MNVWLFTNNAGTVLSYAHNKDEMEDTVRRWAKPPYNGEYTVSQLSPEDVARLRDA